MQRVDLPTLLWRLIDPSATITLDAAPVASRGPTWQAGQLLTGQVLDNLDGQVLVLIDGHRLRADWPGGAPQVPGARVQLQVIGQTAGQWRLAVLTGAKADGLDASQALLAMLDSLDWPLTYSNAERLARFLAGHSQLVGTDQQVEASASDELCPPNIDIWQQLFGYEPGLLSAAFFTWHPFTCGLFVEEKGAGQKPNASDTEPLSFLFVADLPRLGQVEVMGRGRWPQQTIVFVARKETAQLLQKREAELIALLTSTGMELQNLTMRASESPLLKLLQPEMVSYRGLNQRL